MATTGALGQPRAMIPPFPVRRFTVDEYHRMIAADIIGVWDKTELLDGWIIPKTVVTP